MVCRSSNTQSRGDKWVYTNLLAKKLTPGQISIFGQVTTNDNSQWYGNVRACTTTSSVFMQSFLTKTSFQSLKMALCAPKCTLCNTTYFLCRVYREWYNQFIQCAVSDITRTACISDHNVVRSVRSLKMALCAPKCTLCNTTYFLCRVYREWYNQFIQCAVSDITRTACISDHNVVRSVRLSPDWPHLLRPEQCSLLPEEHHWPCCYIPPGKFKGFTVRKSSKMSSQFKLWFLNTLTWAK